jgi:hypothetical protein
MPRAPDPFHKPPKREKKRRDGKIDVKYVVIEVGSPKLFQLLFLRREEEVPVHFLPPLVHAVLEYRVPKTIYELPRNEWQHNPD